MAGIYEVDQIVGKRIAPNRRVLYLVRWKGFSSDHDSWEPPCNLESCKKLLALYNNVNDNPVLTEDGHISTIEECKRRSLEKISEKGAKSNLKPSKNDPRKIGNESLISVSSPPNFAMMERASKNAKDSNANTKKSPSKNVAAKSILTDLSDTFPPKTPSSVDKLLVKKTKAAKNSVVDSSEKPVAKKTRSSIVVNGMESAPLVNSQKTVNHTNKILNRKRKHTDSSKLDNTLTANTTSSHSSPIAKKPRSHLSSAENEKDSILLNDSSASNSPLVREVVDLTKSDSSNTSDSSSISSEREDEDDDDGSVLYLLNSDCDLPPANALDNNETTDKTSNVKVTEIINKSKSCKNNSNETVIKSSKPSKDASKDMLMDAKSKHECKSKGKKKKPRMSLMESKKTSKLWPADNHKSVNPPPSYTTVKDLLADPTNPDPSKPSGNSLPDPVSPEASETYLADVPSSFPVSAEEPIKDQPLSPSSLLYKSLLDSLPGQLHPADKVPLKRGRKPKSDAGDGSSSSSSVTVGKSLFGKTTGKTSVGVVERRTSVRSTECAFRYKQIVVKKCPRYTQIWLNTTTVMKNALNPLVIQEIVSALNSAKYDDSRLVLFSGLGNVFCSGTDLHYLVSGDRAVAARQMAEKIRELTKTFITFPKPIIAAVSGAAVGLGVALLAVCDVVYASDKASFHLPYSQLSQTPEGCSSFTLPLTVGLPAANELLYGGRKITAMEAYQLGLVSQVFWPTLMMQEIIPRAENMASCSSKAMEATKLLIRSHHRTKMELTNETESNLLLESWFSVEGQQAIQAYISNEKNLSF